MRIYILYFLLFASLIPPVTCRSHYEILGVRPTASAHDIKVAYRDLAKKTHPDKNPDDPKAQERFIEISSAYEILSDDVKRREYDMSLRESRNSAHNGRRNNFGGSAHSYTYQNQFEFSLSWSDIFTFFTKLFVFFSPLWIIWVLSLYICCCRGRQQIPPKSKIRENRENRNETHLPVFNFEYSSGKITVLCLHDSLEKELMKLRRVFKKDPIEFFKIEYLRSSRSSSAVPSHHTGNTEEYEDEEQEVLVALSKKGKRWTSLSRVEAENSEEVEKWLIKILNGEVNWKLSSETPLPF